jgi:hypothetical protein
MRWALAILSCLVLLACGWSQTVVSQPPAEVAAPEDDAGLDGGALLDAGGLVPDAGRPIADGGAPDAGVRPDAGSPPDAGMLPDAGVPTRRLVLCLTGAVDESSASNAGFTALCNSLSMSASLVRACSGATCQSTWVTFPNTTVGTAVVNAAFDALDVNRDRLVTSADGPVTLTILGFSWGGVNGEDLAAQLSNDGRITHAALTLRLVVLDAYQPFVGGVTAAPNVDEAWSFRHTRTPPGDCSLTAPLGPYKGVRLRCAAGRRCFDYDFSAAGAQRFSGIAGNAVGHCDVPAAAGAFVTQLVTQGQVTLPLPPAVPVTP